MKKEKSETSKKNEKLIRQIIFCVLIIVLIIILIFLFNQVYNQLRRKKNFENDSTSFSNKNKETIFSIDKIIFFSSCDSKNKKYCKLNLVCE